MFADDTAVISQNKRFSVVISNLQHYVSSLELWLNDWKIKKEQTCDPAQSFALQSDLLRIFRNRSECLAVGDYNAIHRTWNHDDRSNPAGNALHRFARNCGFTITAPADPTWISNRRNSRDSTLDFGVSCGLSNIHAQSIFDLSSDHNPVIFSMTPNSTYKYPHNCCTFTNWEQFQNILSVTVPGNPRINNQDAIENAVKISPTLFKTQSTKAAKLNF
ncbi:putative RNA-directed DNA polymerase from transposon X-element [Trichonephila clavipes]|nr:putative RNA-directed DNA polymerase from transposon X-element [Trichonephila clavipes]